MTQSIVLKSFEELAAALNLDELPEATTVEEVTGSDTPPEAAHPGLNLHEVLMELQTASATLAAIARRDQEARSVALHDLDRYDELVARQREAEQAHERARRVRNEAQALAEGAFAEQTRSEASRVLAIATRAEQAAAQGVEQRRREAEALAAQIDLERLLAARRRQEEADKAQAAEAEKARRLVGALTRARAALDAGRVEEAKRLLGSVESDNPDNPELSSLKTIIAQRELAVKVNAIEEALWEARRVYRRDPEVAVAHLEALDVDGVPEPLVRHVFGEWARACARLCRDRGTPEPLRYAPDPGRGAILTREPTENRYVVMSSLGMGPDWRKGCPVSERQVRRARPLR